MILGARGYPSYYGGFETLIRRLAPALSDAGWDVTVYCRPGHEPRPGVPSDQRVRTVVTRGRDSRALSTLSFGYFGVQHAVRERPDVVLVLNVANGFWLPRLRRAGIATVVNVDGVEWERAKWGKLARRVFYRGAVLTARHADQLVADSRSIQELWRTEFHRESAYIAYGGERPSIVAQHPGPVGPFVLFVARFVPENSIEAFLEAAEVLAQRWPVVMVGSDGEKGHFSHLASQLAAESPHVQWLGHVSDDAVLNSLWQSAGVYFHGHTVGGTNPALVQAMACGAAVIARDTVHNREVLGTAGDFVGEGSQAIVEAVEALMNDPGRRAELSQRAAARAWDQFQWAEVCAHYEYELRRALPARTGAPQ